MTIVVENIDFHRRLENTRILNYGSDHPNECTFCIPLSFSMYGSPEFTVNLDIECNISDAEVGVSYAKVNYDATGMDGTSKEVWNLNLIPIFDNFGGSASYNCFDDFSLNMSGNNKYIAHIENSNTIIDDNPHKFVLNISNRTNDCRFFVYYTEHLDGGVILTDRYDGYSYLYTYNPRTYTNKTIWNQEESKNKLGYITLPNIPTKITSSFCILNNTDIWPSTEIKHYYYTYQNEQEILPMSNEASRHTTFTKTYSHNDDDCANFIFIHIKLSDDNNAQEYYLKYFEASIKGTLSYIPSAIEQPTIQNNFLNHYKYNNNSNILLDNFKGNLNKIIPLPLCQNYITAIKSQITLSSSVDISQGTEIKIATPSFVKYNGIPVNNILQKGNIDGAIPEIPSLLNTTPKLIENYTEDNIFQVVAYDAVMEYNVSDLSLKYDYQKLDSSIIYQSSSCIENIFHLNFPIPEGYLAMRCYYDEPEYITYTIPQDIPANEKYTFEVLTPSNITNGIVYHMDVPVECSMNIEPVFTEIEPITSLQYNDDIYGTCDDYINIKPEFNGTTVTFEVTGGILPAGLSLNKFTGEITGKCLKGAITTITITGRNLISSISADINIKIISDIQIVDINHENYKEYLTSVIIVQHNQNISINTDNFIVKLSGNLVYNSCSITCDSLPDGLTWSNNELSGTLNKGNYSVLFTISTDFETKQLKLYIISI